MERLQERDLCLTDFADTSFLFKFKYYYQHQSCPSKTGPKQLIPKQQQFIIVELLSNHSTMKTQSRQQSVSVKLYDFISLHPTPIRSLFIDTQQARLYVSRDSYSEIYEMDVSGPHPVLQQIAELQPSLHFVEIGGVMALFKPFQLRVFRLGRWEAHSFTTQLLSIRVVGHTVYSFHEKETIAWELSQDDFGYRFLGQGNAPYHLDADGTIVGFGKKVRPAGGKQAPLTICEVISGKWVFVGDSKGGLHVYDWRLLAHVKTFNEHQGPILAIKIDETTNSVYFTGSDSKVCMARLVGEEWKLGLSVRGQSHDILSLEKAGKYLISGGVTTDLCFYQLQEGELGGEFQHKVGYFGSTRTDSEGKLVVVNHRNCFQVWQLGTTPTRSELMVRYEMPADKFIVDCKIYREPIEEQTHLILVVTDEDTIGWKFHPEIGLQKYITIQNQYTLVQLLPKHSFYGIRADGLLERVNCSNGKIQEITYCEVGLPTDLLVLGGGMVLLGSKVTNTIHIISAKAREVVKKMSFSSTYTYVDQLSPEELIIHYFNSPVLYRLELHSEKQTELVQLPVSLVRFGGWLGTVSREEKQVKARPKKYWFGVSEGKVVIVPNLQSSKKKKVRSKQTDRIAQVIKPKGNHLGCNLALIPFNFQRMIDQIPIRPLFTKKIV